MVARPLYLPPGAIVRTGKETPAGVENDRPDASVTAFGTPASVFRFLGNRSRLNSSRPLSRTVLMIPYKTRYEGSKLDANRPCLASKAQQVGRRLPVSTYLQPFDTALQESAHRVHPSDP